MTPHPKQPATTVPVPSPRRWLLPALFVALALPVSLLMAWRVPIGAVPDEANHIFRIDSIRLGHIVGERFILHEPTRDLPTAGVRAESVLIPLGAFFRDLSGHPWVTAESVDTALKLPWTPWDKPNQVAPNTAVYPPTFYLPAAAVFQVSHMAGIGPYRAILAARIVNALVYAAFGAATLYATRRGVCLMFAVLLLPMSLSLAGSCNPDGLTLAALALSLGLLTAADAEPREHRWRGITGCVGLALFIMFKPPYAPFAAVLLLALRHEKRRRLGAITRCLATVVAVLLPAVLWFIYAQHEAGAALRVSVPYHPGPLSRLQSLLLTAPDARLQAQTILRHPFLPLLLAINLAAEQPMRCLHQMIGVIGNLDLSLPDAVYAAWYVALAGAAVACLAGKVRDRPGAAVVGAGLIGAIGALSFVLVVTAEYLTWTDVGATRVEGFQGRYALPILLMLAIGVPHIVVRFRRILLAASVAATVMAAVWTSVVLPHVLEARYYVPQ
ncbi:MAG TPA: DUF2142 domain-containing protein [Acidisphaera sp.]|nr:DUF2142 domain-containing protein [Acidisphaera sp.]